MATDIDRIGLSFHLVGRCQRQANPLNYLNYSNPIVLI